MAGSSDLRPPESQDVKELQVGPSPSYRHLPAPTLGVHMEVHCPDHRISQDSGFKVPAGVPPHAWERP